MKESVGLGIPQSGMNRDSNPAVLKNTHYSEMLNGNIENEDDNTMLVQNEHSNVLCSRLEGFKVIGYKTYSKNNCTYFFLVKEKGDGTYYGRVAVFESSDYIESIEDIEQGSGWDIERVLQGPLELSEDRYKEMCGNMKVLITDEYCTDGTTLGFDLCHPIKTIEVKDEKCGLSIYWTDGLNPPRYLNLSKLYPADGSESWYSYLGEPVCGDYSETTPVCLAVEKLRIFPLREIPCINVEAVTNGGSLRCGSYQFCVALCDQFGNEITNYSSLTNPVTIFNDNDIVVRDGYWGADSGMGIKLDMMGLDEYATHYKVGVIQYVVGPNGEVNKVEEYIIEGVHPVSESSVYYMSDQGLERTTLSHLALTKPVYGTARGIANSGNKLLMYGLTAENEWNLQPICNLLGSFLYWQTSIGGEDLYKYGKGVSEYGEYMRDEVYPFSIRFLTKDGYQTAAFPLVPRPATEEEEAVVVDDHGEVVNDYKNHENEILSILDSTASCERNTRTKYWQFFNTAKVKGAAPSCGKVATDDCKEYVDVQSEYSFHYDYANFYNEANPGGTVDMRIILQHILRADEVDKYMDILEDEIRTVCDESLHVGDYFDERICEILDGLNSEDIQPFMLPKPDFDTTDDCELDSLSSRKVTLEKVNYTGNAISFVKKTDEQYGNLDTTPLYDSAFSRTPDASVLLGLYDSSILKTFFSMGGGNIYDAFSLVADYVGLVYTTKKDDSDVNTSHSNAAATVFGSLGGTEEDLSSIHDIKIATTGDELDPFMPDIIHKTNNVYANQIDDANLDWGALVEGCEKSLANKLTNHSMTDSYYPVNLSDGELSGRVRSLLYMKDTDETNKWDLDRECPFNTGVADLGVAEIAVSQTIDISSGCTGRPHICSTRMARSPKNTSSSTILKLLDTSEDAQKLYWSVFSGNEYYKFCGLSPIFGHIPTSMSSMDTNSEDAVVFPFTFFHKQLSKNAHWLRIPRPEVFDKDIDPSEKYVYLNCCGINCKDFADQYEGSGQRTTNIYGSRRVRLTFFKDTKGTIMRNPITNDKKGAIVYTCENTLQKLVPGDFIDESGNQMDAIYLVIDFPILVLPLWMYYKIEDGASKRMIQASFSCATLNSYYSATLRMQEIYSIEIHADSLSFSADDTYLYNCKMCADGTDGINCATTPYQYGTFSYWESTDLYPNNKYLYDSSNIKINASAVKDSTLLSNIKKGLSGYDWSGDTVSGAKLCGTNIRHYKFPNALVSPPFGTEATISATSAKIYPIGLYIDDDIVKAFMDIAVTNGLINKNQRDRIGGYEILRGDRVLNKSVLGTGVAYDIWKCKDSNTSGTKDYFYANYPYNDLNDDIYLFDSTDRASLISHPYKKNGNDKYVFFSPNTTFTKPSVPTELSFEGYESGTSTGCFPELTNHSRWILLGSKAESTAKKLCTIDFASNMVGMLGNALSTFSKGGSIWETLINVAGNAVGLLVGAAQEWLRAADNFNSWMTIFRNMGHLKNYAYYYTSYGIYNRFIPNDIDGNVLRGLHTSKYVSKGLWALREVGAEDGKVILNNRDRESSLYLSLGKYKYDYPVNIQNYENSRIADNSSIIQSGGSVNYENKKHENTMVFSMREQDSRIVSPYFRIKVYKANQYGDIDSIKWVSTGKCYAFGDCRHRMIYGGDTYISRMSVKRQFPYFYINSVNIADMTPFAYYDYRNIGYPKYFVNFETETSWADTDGIGSNLYPMPSTSYNLACKYNIKDGFYVFGKFYTASYGQSLFLTESDINCNFRLVGTNYEDDFYPHVGDYITWTQEYKIPIGTDNIYSIDPTYLNVNHALSVRKLPATYDKPFYDCAYQRPNGVIWSREDVSENSLVDPWLIYKPLNFFEFPTRNGNLVHMKGIEGQQVLCRFENQVSLYNAVDVLKSRMNEDDLGTGGLFSSRPAEYNTTDLGYTGSQSTEMVSNEFGHFWVDVKRANVFKVKPNGTGLVELTPGIRHWLRENLPFKILNYGITKKGSSLDESKVITYSDLDNKFSGIGLTLGWDNKYKRLFITKKDYIPVQEASKYAFDGCNFTFNGNPVNLTDTSLFEDVSFTLAYSCLKEEWISYYSFKPDYYVEHMHYFQTGLNFSSDSNELGLWSHLLTNQSYQVFYGKLYPFMIEVPVIEDFTHKILSVFRYEMEARRYHSKIDWAAQRMLGFNRGYIYNSTNNSGLLHFVPEDKDDMAQKLEYPIQHDDSREILVTDVDGRWNINDFFNVTTNDINNVPLWEKDRNDIWREVNVKAIHYDRIWNDRMKGDWFLARMINDVESRYKLVYKWNLNQIKTYM